MEKKKKSGNDYLKEKIAELEFKVGAFEQAIPELEKTIAEQQSTISRLTAQLQAKKEVAAHHAHVKKSLWAHMGCLRRWWWLKRQG